jgi:membrane protein CcdC involved in cytochrome C biogenesis
LISATLFGALHFNKSFLGAFVLGLIFAVLVIQTSSIYAAILVHGMYNATILTLRVFFGFSIVGDVKMLSHLNYWMPELLCGLAGLLLLAPFYVWPWRLGNPFELKRSDIAPLRIENEGLGART